MGDRQQQTIITKISQQISVTKSADGSVSSELSLVVVEWKDGGTYTCLAREISSAAEGAKPTKQEIIMEIYGKCPFSYEPH